MSTDRITTLVIGKPQELTLGPPVGQTLSPIDPANALTWSGGAWTDHEAIDVAKPQVSDPAPLHVPAALDLTLGRPVTDTEVAQPAKVPIKASRLKALFQLVQQNPKLFAAAASFLVCIPLSIGATWYILKGNPVPSDSPFAPANDPVAKAGRTAVQVVDAPFPVGSPTPAEQAPSNPAPPAAVEPEAGAKVAAAPVMAPVPANVLREKGGAPPPQQTNIKPTEKKDPLEPKQAVIMDDVPAAKQGTQASPATVKVEVKPKVESVPTKGAGLVALTPDGKFALFTNSQTRLPEKYGIGDKLPSGETIKAIDKASGKVDTDGKQYRLE